MNEPIGHALAASLPPDQFAEIFTDPRIRIRIRIRGHEPTVVIVDELTFPPADGTPEGESYQQFLDSMALYCRCRDSERPCDGVLADGMCDGLMDDERELFDDDEPEDDGYPFDCYPYED